MQSAHTFSSSAAPSPLAFFSGLATGESAGAFLLVPLAGAADSVFLPRAGVFFGAGSSTGSALALLLVARAAAGVFLVGGSSGGSAAAAFRLAPLAGAFLPVTGLVGETA